MMAACALVHKLTVASRNVRYFARFQLPPLNPFDFDQAEK
jgi:predicted nucleic acid-binding protein